MWYSRWRQKSRRKRIDSLTRRMDRLTAQIQSINEPWSEYVIELERERAKLYFKRAVLFEKEG